MSRSLRQPWMDWVPFPFWLWIQEGLHESDPAREQVRRCYELRFGMFGEKRTRRQWNCEHGKAERETDQGCLE